MIRRNQSFTVLVFLCFNAILTFGQTIKGNLHDGTNPVAGVLLQLQGTNYEAISNGLGNFTFESVNNGSYQLIAIENGTPKTLLNVDIKGKDIDLGQIIYVPNRSDGEDITIVDISELAGIENENDNFSSVLSASRDPFVNAAAFNLGSLRFRPRGYFNEDSEIIMNGMQMNDQDDGRVLWTAWSGLNDVVRVQTPIINLAANDYMFGGIGGGTYVDLRASSQRKQVKAVYTLSNRTYAHRAMLTYSTGLKPSGWAFTFSGSHRFGNGYIDGTFFNGTSYFASVDKRINKNHNLNFVIFGTPQVRGRAFGAVKEVYELSNSNYFNAVWGYQNGKVRNSREYRINQPVAMLRHDWKISTKSNMTTTFGVQWGTFASTNLDWYEAPDPRADYYRKLPSFVEDLNVRQLLTNYYREDSDRMLVDWHGMYAANAGRNYTIKNANGSGKDVTGRLAAYAVIAEHFDNNKLNFNTVLTSILNSKYTLTAGLNGLHEVVNNYRKMDDLLGAEFYVNYDKFADQSIQINPDFIQNDLNNPNGLVYEGDIYNYNFDIITTRLAGWSQIIKTGKVIDWYGAVNVSFQNINREGFMRNGKFPENSFGKGEGVNFFNYGTKLGATYKINGRNYIVANASYRTRAPFASDAFISNRTRYQVVDNLESEKILAGELSYLLRDPSFKGRISAFYTQFTDQLNNLTFYLDTDQTFGNFTTNGINKRHVGIEGGFEKKLDSRWSATVAGSIGQYLITSRPEATITYDNRVGQSNTTVYFQNYYVAGMPQTAGTVGLKYNSDKYWFASVNVNYFANHYAEMNPLRRTDVAVTDVSPQLQPILFNSIIEQEKLPPGYVVDIFCGKSWKIKKDYFLAVNLNVSNILNNQNLIIGAREQLRFDFENKNVNRFPSRYIYAFGTNYNLNISLRF